MARAVRREARLWAWGLVLGVAVLAAGKANGTTITFNPFTDPHPTPTATAGTIGFSYAGDMFVGSVQLDGSGVLYSCDLNGGSVAAFAPSIAVAAGPPTASSEHFVAGSLGLGGFPSRDIYVASGLNGILHINHAGTASSTFVTGLGGYVRSILFDHVGTFGNDMLVATSLGNIYRITSGGVPTLLASVGEDTEGMDIAPTGAGANFGPYNGQLIVCSETSGFLRAVTPGGLVTIINPNNLITSAEEASFVPLDLGLSGNPVEGMYGANYTENVLKATVSQFTGLQGDLIVTGETTHQVNRVHWNGSSFAFTNVGSFSAQPEDGLFVTSAHIIGGNLPEPASLVLFGAYLLGLRRYLRRRDRRQPVGR